jgi:hypothetical protein
LTRSHLPALLLAATLAAPHARADAPEESVKRADQLFREGQRLLKQGKLPEACVSFEESQRLDPALGTLLNLADCHAQIRRFATARAEFEEAARQAAQAGQREREAFAREQLRQLEPLLSLLTVKSPVAPDPPSNLVKVDDRDVEPASAKAPIPLDPGPHDLRFAAPGFLPRTIRVEIANGPSAQAVDAPRLEPEPQIVPPTPPTQEPRRDDGGQTRRIAGLAALAGGGVALLAGGYFGLHAASKKSDAEQHCSGRYCDAEGLSLQDDAHVAATVSTIAFLLGIAAAGAGAYLYLTAPRSPKGLALRVAATGARVEARW